MAMSRQLTGAPGARPARRRWTIVVALATLLTLSGLPVVSGGAATADSTRYLVILNGLQTGDTFEIGGNSALNHATALALIETAGGDVSNDLSRQIGVIVATSSNSLFAATLLQSELVDDVGEEYVWKGVPTIDEALASGATIDGGGPEQTADPLEAEQWDMLQIRAPEAHNLQAGWRAVDVGILDTGIDGRHLDFYDDPTNPQSATNVDCARGRNSIAFLPGGPGVGTPDPCVDNGFHGTHVAGTVGAQANNYGMVGVAPNVTLVPVKVCDASGYCYASAVVDGVTYAGDQQFDVINMSFFVDDNEFQQSTEFKCMDDPVQRSFRKAVERAIQYARNRGVTPVAALGNSDEDLAHPSETENNCEVVPAETQGVIGTMSLGRQSEKARYSNYGAGATDIGAPGGNGTTGDCQKTILSTFPGNAYFCIQGTSMASPHAAGVAALIVSQFGTLGSDGDVKLSPTKVESRLQATTIDIGLSGYDECFGHGRIDALRAVTHDTSAAYDASAPGCPEYAE